MKKKGWVILAGISIFFCFVLSDPSLATMSVYIPGAHNVMAYRFDDLTTNNPAISRLSEPSRLAVYPSDWNPDGKAPKKPRWYTAAEKIPGLQIEGWFADSRFVIRIPDKWNGRLVMGGVPGVRDERSADDVFSDYVLTMKDSEARSFAYAATDKGTIGEVIPAPDGKLYPALQGWTTFMHPQDKVDKWMICLRQLTLATQDLLARTRGKKPDRTYLIGISNGGYVVRAALERDGELYDGGVDWEGAIFRANEPNLISSLVEAFNSYQVYSNKATSAEEKAVALKRLRALGLPEGSEFLWPFYASFVYLGTINWLRMAYDPTFIHRNWWEYSLNPQDYKDYDYFRRPAFVKEAIAKIENTGDIKKPLITVHGTWDAFVFSNVHAIPYERLVKERNKGDIYRLYLIDQGTHHDALVGNPGIDAGKKLQPLLPYVHQAFNLLIDWVEAGKSPPASKTIAKPPTEGKTYDIRTGAEVDPY
jgi:pimeloyl-ACP methyl ester carboxylesterase